MNSNNIELSMIENEIEKITHKYMLQNQTNNRNVTNNNNNCQTMKAGSYNDNIV